MTLLVVDIGNSRVKWGWSRLVGIDAGEPFPTDSQGIHSQLQVLWTGLPKPSAVYLSNVAGSDLERQVADWVRDAWGLETRVIRSEAETRGMVNGYEQPETLGVDRWVGLIGARAAFGLPLCLIDCGTAVTVDLVDAYGKHRGGVIAPGLHLMRECLLQRARGIVASRAPGGGFWGRSTSEGLENGLLQMVLGLIDRALLHAGSTLGAEPTVVLTGGDAERVAAHLHAAYHLAPHIVLQGLAEIARNEL